MPQPYKTCSILYLFIIKTSVFALARAYLPIAQTIDNGVVDVVIANPKFNNFNIENKSLVSDD